MGDIAVSVKNLSKRFVIPREKQDKLKDRFVNPFKRVKKDKFFALNDVKFEVKKGEFVGIIGRNGSGKSTLLKILSGVYEPTSGSIWTSGSMVPFLELGVGFNPELTGRENIILNGVILGMTTKYMEEKTEEIIDFAEIREFIDMQVKNYSSGMILRLGFAIAKEIHADLYLLDEILGVGDAHFQKKCADVFRNIKKRKATVLLVSHDLYSVERLCSKVVLLDKGKVIFAGKTKDAITKYRQITVDQEIAQEKNEDNQGKVVTTGQIELQKFELSKHLFTSSETDNLKITVKYTSKTDIENTAYGVSIFYEDGSCVYGTNNYSIEKMQTISQGQNEINISIDVSRLLNGNYFITFGIFEMYAVTPILLYDRYYKFSVNKSTKDLGLVYIPVKWN